VIWNGLDLPCLSGFGTFGTSLLLLLTDALDKEVNTDLASLVRAFLDDVSLSRWAFALASSSGRVLLVA
jgi:hypothetical protein